MVRAAGWPLRRKGRSDVHQTDFSRQTDFQVSNDGFLTPAVTLTNPLPSGQLFPVLGAVLGAETGIDTNLTFFADPPKVPSVRRWQLGLQKAVKGGFLIGAGYITRVETNRDLDAISNSCFCAEFECRNDTIAIRSSPPGPSASHAYNDYESRL